MTRDMLATWWGPADRPGGVTTRLWLPGVVFDAGHLPGGPDLVQVEDFTVEMHASLQTPLRLCGPAGDGDPVPARTQDGRAAGPTVRNRSGDRRGVPVLGTAPPAAVLGRADRPAAPAGCGAGRRRHRRGHRQRAGSPGSPVPFTMLADVPGSSALDPSLLRAGLPGILTAQATAPRAAAVLRLRQAVVRRP